jgi:hypothetical protein
VTSYTRPVTEGEGRRLSLLTRELRTAGPDVLDVLPAPEQLAAKPEVERRRILEGLRVELYAIAAIIADATVQQARRERPSYPPYGLVRSMYTDFKLMSASPETVSEGSIDSFYTLGKVYVETMVFHLHRQFNEQLASDKRWMSHRLEELLALFRVGAGPATRARMRDGLSFIYGGLHFGTGVCVQLTEVMARLLAPVTGLSVDEKAAVIARSSRPAHRLASLNLDHVLVAYQNLQAPARSPATSRPGPAAPSWMDAGKFVVQRSGDTPWRIDLRDEAAVLRSPRGGQLDEAPTTYETHGCPARHSPTSGPSPIAELWSWGVELARDAELLGPGPT